MSKEEVLVHNWMCTKKKAEEITNLLKDGENLKDTTSKFKEFIEKHKISDKMDILDNLHRKMPNVREKYLKDVKDLMDSGKSEAEIVDALSKYDKTFSELESLSKKERKTIKNLTSTENFNDVSNVVDDIIKNRSDSDILKANLEKEDGLNNVTGDLTAQDIPTAKSGGFNEFFNSLTSDELDELWKDKSIRKKIERELREPGELHEWHMVSRAPQFKYWKISSEQIKDLRSVISDVKFKNPTGKHGGLGSTKAHNELLGIIDSSQDYDTFVRRLNNWATYRLEGGINSLPEGLRL